MLAVATIAAIGLGFAMSRAERRARRNLYRALGISADAVDRLMARNADVLAELAAVRTSNGVRDTDLPAGAAVIEGGVPIEPEVASPRAVTRARPSGPPATHRSAGAWRGADRGRRHT